MTRFKFSQPLFILVLLPLVFAACSPSGPAISQVSLVQNPNPSVPLASVLSLTADQPVTLTINIDDGDRQWTIAPSSERSSQFEVPVIGLRGARTHTITATITNAGGNSTTSEG